MASLRRFDLQGPYSWVLPFKFFLKAVNLGEFE